MKGTDFYHTMEIKRTASGDEIKYAYRRLAQRLHPDVSDDPNGETKFKALAEAYRTLRKPELRAAYDGFPPASYASDNHLNAYRTWHAWSTLFVYPFWVSFWNSWRCKPNKNEIFSAD